MVAISKFDREHIFDAVKLMYTAVANEPEREFHFPTGRWICEFLGYPSEQLDAVPPTALESFAGVGYPFAGDVIRPGDTVLDIGAGAGTDVFISSLLVEAHGKVYGLDMTRAMNEKLQRNLELAGVGNIEPLFGNAEEIPLPDASVDVVTSNGVLNLVPDKALAFGEIFRVLKPGGRIQISDIIINTNTEALEKSKTNPRLWAECIVGALQADLYKQTFVDAGFADVVEHRRSDYFGQSSNEATRKIAASFTAESMTLSARKP